MGELVVTSLNQFSMPFIRYKNGDMGIYEPEICRCKRGMPVLREIAGRIGDFLVTSDGKFVHMNFFASVFAKRPEIFRYQVYQPDTQHLEVRLILREEVSTAFLEGISTQIQDHFGPAMQVSIQILDEISLTRAGKHRFVISDIKPDWAL